MTSPRYHDYDQRYFLQATASVLSRMAYIERNEIHVAVISSEPNATSALYRTGIMDEHIVKPHGKMQIMGLGTALTILLLPEHLIKQALVREEIVAFINTIGKFSDAISHVKDLSHLALVMDEEKSRNIMKSPSATGLGRRNMQICMMTKKSSKVQRRSLIGVSIGE